MVRPRHIRSTARPILRRRSVAEARFASRSASTNAISAHSISRPAIRRRTLLDLTIARRIADYVALAISHQRLAEEGRRAAALEERNAKLEVRVKTLTEELDSRSGLRRMAGESKAWKDVLTQAAKVASTDTTVLLLGESGTGKEVVARLLVRERPDHARPPAFDRGARHDRARFATVPVQQVEGGKDARAHTQAALRSASAATGSSSGARHRKVPK
jgi:transcriptional regulator with AAA-type ATPase domain